MNKDQILGALNWRYATKKYDSGKKISETDWVILKESLRLSPSSYGLQPWKFLHVQNPEIRKQLREASWGQSMIEECSHLVVFTTLKKMTKDHIVKNIQETAKIRGIEASALEGYQKFMEKTILARTDEDLKAWNQKQAYIALGFLLETAAFLKIDATPIEGFEPAKYDQILGLDKTEYGSAVVATLGYRHAEDVAQAMKKSRFSDKDLFQVI